MCKGQDRSIAVEQVRLLYKSGGKSGIYRADRSGHMSGHPTPSAGHPCGRPFWF